MLSFDYAYDTDNGVLPYNCDHDYGRPTAKDNDMNIDNMNEWRNILKRDMEVPISSRRYWTEFDDGTDTLRIGAFGTYREIAIDAQQVFDWFANNVGGFKSVEDFGVITDITDNERMLDFFWESE